MILFSGLATGAGLWPTLALIPLACKHNDEFQKKSVRVDINIKLVAKDKKPDTGTFFLSIPETKYCHAAEVRMIYQKESENIYNLYLSEKELLSEPTMQLETEGENAYMDLYSYMYRNTYVTSQSKVVNKLCYWELFQEGRTTNFKATH